MHLPCAALVEEFCGLPQLGTPYDGIVDKQQAAVFDKLMDWDQFHLGDKVPLALHSGHERAGPSRRIFNERPGKGDAGFISIANGMGCARIGHTGNGVWLGIVPFG